MRQFLPGCVLLLVVGCKFDPGGVAVGGDDDSAVPDASAGDARPLDAMIPDGEAPDAMDDLDDDDDTILDTVDNCPALANTDQHDEDGDLVGDLCDNCPTAANATQANTTEPSGVTGDQVGDACDPHLATADVIGFFDPFSGTGAPAGWTSVGGGTWTQAGDKVAQSSSSVIAYLYKTGLTTTNMVVETSIDVVTVPPGTGSGGRDFRSIGTMSFFTAGATTGTGYMCLVLDDANDNNNAVVFAAPHTDAGDTTGSQNSPELSGGLAAGQNAVLRSSANGTTFDCTLVRATPVTVSITNSAYTSGTVALRTNTVAASFRYVIVYTPAP